MADEWIRKIKRAKKTSTIQKNFKKVQYIFDKNNVLLEEYNTSSQVCTRRAWKVKGILKCENEWNTEIGDPITVLNSPTVKANSTQPFIRRRNTRHSIEWWIRNNLYNIDVYSVTADAEKKCLTVRTSNKKYYKELNVPELERIGLLVEQDRVKYKLFDNALIISYAKPQILKDMEKNVYEEAMKVSSADIEKCKITYFGLFN